MKTLCNKITLGAPALLTLAVLLLSERTEAAPPVSHSQPLIVAQWWEIPFQPPEKGFSPKWEDDERYKKRQQKKYRKRE